MKSNYIIWNEHRGELLLEDLNEKEVLEKVEFIRNGIIEKIKERMREEEKDLEYFYEGQYDKMSILDRPWFLERGEEGLKDLERETKRIIEDYKKDIEEYSDAKAFRIFKEV